MFRWSLVTGVVHFLNLLLFQGCIGVSYLWQTKMFITLKFQSLCIHQMSDGTFLKVNSFTYYCLFQWSHSTLVSHLLEFQYVYFTEFRFRWSPKEFFSTGEDFCLCLYNEPNRLCYTFHNQVHCNGHKQSSICNKNNNNNTVVIIVVAFYMKTWKLQ